MDQEDPQIQEIWGTKDGMFSFGMSLCLGGGEREVRGRGSFWEDYKCFMDDVGHEDAADTNLFSSAQLFNDTT